MAGNGPAPNPDARRRTTHPNSPGMLGAWVELPATGRTGPPPDLPTPPPWLEKLDGWPVATRSEWKRIWETPQSTRFDQSGISLHQWAQQHAFIALMGPTAAGLAELRQIEDRHGLSPRALLQLRWRISTMPVEEEPVEEKPEPKRRGAKPVSRKDRVLKIIEGGGNASPKG